MGYGQSVNNVKGFEDLRLKWYGKMKKTRLEEYMGPYHPILQITISEKLELISSLLMAVEECS